MNDKQYEESVERLGKLREQLRQLEDVDYATALYKGYSSSGQTLSEIQDSMTDVQDEIDNLEMKIDQFEW